MCFVLTFSIENVNNLNKKKNQEFIRGNLKQTYHHQMKNKKKEIVAKKEQKKPFNEHLLNVFNVRNEMKKTTKQLGCRFIQCPISMYY